MGRICGVRALGAKVLQVNSGFDFTYFFESLSGYAICFTQWNSGAVAEPPPPNSTRVKFCVMEKR